MKTYKVRFTEDAFADLVGIETSLSAWSGVDVAEAWLLGIEATRKSLAQFPNRASYVPELLALGIKTFRELLYDSYRVIFRVDDDVVHIMIVAHAKRDFSSILQERVLGAR
jgi:toxin ParE1/3/4